MSMLLQHTVKPSVDHGAGAVRLDEWLSEGPIPDPARQLREQFFSTVVHTRDEAIRQGLIALGWTPPPPPRRAPSATDQGDVRMRVRANDPCSSIEAAEQAAAFVGSHKERILQAMGDMQLSSHQIATLARLTVVQVDRRLVELRREGEIDLVMDEHGDEVLRLGYRVWRRLRSSAS